MYVWEEFMIAFFQCLNFTTIVSDLRLATCVANGKVAHQKPGVIVGHLHNTVKRLVKGFLHEKLARLEVSTGGKTSQHHY